MHILSDVPTGLLHLPVLHIPTNQFSSRMTSLPSGLLAMLPSSSKIPVVQAMIPLDLCRGLVLLTRLIIFQFFLWFVFLCIFISTVSCKTNNAWIVNLIPSQFFWFVFIYILFLSSSAESWFQVQNPTFMSAAVQYEHTGSPNSHSIEIYYWFVTEYYPMLQNAMLFNLLLGIPLSRNEIWEQL